MNLTEIKTQINRLSEDEMRSLNHYIVETLRAAEKHKSELAKRDLSIGMRVRINHPKAGTSIYIIEKIARAKATLSKEGQETLTPFGGRLLTTAPLSLLEII
jgi:hypothetical protein